MKSRKRQQKLEDSIMERIEQLQKDLDSQRRALLRVEINAAEKYRCPYTGETKYRRRTRVLSIDDARLPPANRKELARIQVMYTGMIANLKRSLREVANKDDVRDYSKRPTKKAQVQESLDIERFLQTGTYDKSDETN